MLIVSFYIFFIADDFCLLLLLYANLNFDFIHKFFNAAVVDAVHIVDHKNKNTILWRVF